MASHPFERRNAWDSPRVRFGLRAGAGLWLAVAAAGAQPVDLQLDCRPVHGLLDRRPQRPTDVQQHSRFSTYYLLDNPQLFEYRVSLTNVSPERIGMRGGEGWARDLNVHVERAGVPLGPQDLRIDTLRQSLRSLVYLERGERVAEPRFRRRFGAPGSEPLMPYDDERIEEFAATGVPERLATNDEFVVVLRLRAADGGDLPLGLYELSVADEANGVSCHGTQLVVMRAPLSPLETVDAHVVRANAHQAKGDLEAAAGELEKATELVPGSLKAWCYRAALAFARQDLQGQSQAATRLEALLAPPALPDEDEFEGVVRDAQAVAATAPELRRLLEESRSAVGR